MGKKIVVDPVTRIEGHLKITVEMPGGLKSCFREKTQEMPLL